MSTQAGTQPTPVGSLVKILVPITIGACVSIALGLFGRLHNPTGIAVNIAGFSSPQTVKVWLATGAAFFGLLQLTSALVMFGKVPGVSPPSWIGAAHRWGGRIAFLLTVPVAVHCLYAFGFQTFDTRVLVHSLLGCVFFGAFTAKMLLLPKRGLPGWTLPVAGGLVFAVLIGFVVLHELRGEVLAHRFDPQGSARTYAWRELALRVPPADRPAGLKRRSRVPDPRTSARQTESRDHD